MRLLDRYLLRELLLPLGYCLGGFVVFWLVFDIFTELSDFQKYRLGVADVAEYYLVTMPEKLVLLLPIGLLLALLYALSNHARHNEITAMRAAGVSLWRLSRPYWLVALVFGGAVFCLNEYALPDAAEEADKIKARHGDADSRAVQRQWKRGVTFHNDVARRHWRIGLYHPRSGQMVNLALHWEQPDGNIRQLAASAAAYVDGRWFFTNVQELIYPQGAQTLPPPARHETLELIELTETPRLIRSEIKVNDMLGGPKSLRRVQLSINDILEYLRLHPDLEDRRSDLLLTLLHQNLAAPFTCLVVVLIALPFGAVTGRRNVFAGVASSIAICFVFFLLREIGVALGSGGRIPPWVAGWAPNLIFGIVGIIRIQRVR
jgi:lipopolysaccharide export system permease protein